MVLIWPFHTPLSIEIFDRERERETERERGEMRIEGERDMRNRKIC